MLPNQRESGAVSISGTDDGCCGVFYLKWVLNIFNFLLLMSGLTILAVGLWTFFDKQWLAGTLSGDRHVVEMFDVLMYLLIGIGAFVFIVAFSVGCCATVNVSRAGLMLYAVILMLVFLMEASSGVITYVYEHQVHGSVKAMVNRTLVEKYHSDSSAATAINRMQTTKHCCGSGSYNDWAASAWYKTQRRNRSVIVPDTCCVRTYTDCGLHRDNIYTDSCSTHMEEELRVHLNIMGAMGLGLCCLQIFGIIFSCCLAKKLRRLKTRTVNHYWDQ